MTTTTSAAAFTRTDAAALLGGAGIIGIIAAHVTDTAAVGGVAAVLLILGAVLGVSAGWFAGLPPAAATAPASLIGAQVPVGGQMLTVVDASSPSAAAALRGGGRCAVAAADTSGRIGWLFLGLDARGRIVEAATAERPWQPM